MLLFTEIGLILVASILLFHRDFLCISLDLAESLTDVGFHVCWNLVLLALEELIQTEISLLHLATLLIFTSLLDLLNVIYPFVGWWLVARCKRLFIRINVFDHEIIKLDG